MLETAEKEMKDTISYEDYVFLQPLNGIYEKWAMDVVSVYKVFKPFRNVMPGCFYQISKRNEETLIFPLWDKNAKDGLEDVIARLKEEKHLRFLSAFGTKNIALSYEKGQFYIQGKKADQKELEGFLQSFEEIMVIQEEIIPAKAFSKAVIQLIVCNEHGDDPIIGDAHISFTENEETKIFEINKKTGHITSAESFPDEISYWKEITDTVERMCRFAPQLEFFGLEILLTDDGFKIMQIQNRPEYPKRYTFSPDTLAYLNKKLQQKKRANTLKKRIAAIILEIKTWVLGVLSRICFPKTMKTVKWLREQRKDFLTNKDTSLKEKIWAFRHGFISYRLHQYGITEDNWKNYISDFEYRWLRHINNDYRLWMEDKITVKYICSDYKECFPEYYYHIILKNGKNKILPMMDCPNELGATYEDIFKLVQMKKYLALKPDEGSHGNGFYKFTYYGGKYYLNHKEVQKQEVLDILQDDNNQYLITEYIDMHPEIKRIYAGAVNTIRMIVFKKDGKTPQIGNAYMRFGSKRTGAVDNMGAGGMYARIDVETGRFYDAKIIEANEIKPCLYHPDTNEKIEGYLPNWESVKQKVLDVAKDIQQLEYFGFDLALTPDGFKFPEINRFPDYPAIEKYSPETMDYLLYRLDIKKKECGYDKTRGHCIFKLPNRS